MRLRHYFILLFSLSGFSASTQQMETINFTETTFDFGKVQEANGPIIHEFWFENNGEEPITIVNVKASCGCTTPAWSKEPVLPGKSGFIQAQYNPTNRPGNFNKSLTVTTNIGQPLRLYIKGQVEPKVKTIEEKFKTEIGALRLKHSSLNLGKVYFNKEESIHEFEIYNQSDKPLVFLKDMETPAHIKVVIEPNTLAPKTEGKLKIIYNASIKRDMGFMNDNITLHTDEAGELADKNLTVYATIEEYFGPMTKEELEKAPQLKFDNVVYDFGRVQKNKNVSTDFIITNTGESDLEIRKISPNCTCVTGITNTNNIKSGKSIVMTVTFDSKDRRGNQQKSITIYSNDPRASAQRITIKAYVEE